jgi:hypothetical protein
MADHHVVSVSGLPLLQLFHKGEMLSHLSNTLAPTGPGAIRCERHVQQDAVSVSVSSCYSCVNSIVVKKAAQPNGTLAISYCKVK